MAATDRQQRHTIKLPKDLREMDILPFVCAAKAPTIQHRNQELLFAYREELAVVGNKKNNLTTARTNTAQKFFMTTSNISLLTKDFNAYLRGLAIPPPEPTPIEHTNARQSDENVRELIRQLSLVREGQAEISKRIRDLAAALHDGGNSELKTAISKLPWVHD